MKRTKRLAATAAALIMAVGMIGGTSLMTANAAAVPVSITVSDSDDHNYVAYQIFTGNVGTMDGSNVIMADSDLDLGSGVNAEAFYAALGLEGTDQTPAKALSALKDKTGAQIATLLKSTGVLNDTNNVTLAKGDNDDFVSGYVYIMETSSEEQLKDVTGDLLKIVNDVEISPKIGAPGVEKKVKENTRDIEGNGTKIGATYEIGYNDAADYSIGDMVPFTIYGTIPSDFGNYDHYFYEFNDRLAAGFKAVTANKIHVFVDDKEITEGFTVKVVNAGATDPTFITVTFNDLKAINGITKDTKIKLQYEAELDSDAVTTIEGNTNEVYLTYTNDNTYRGFGYTDEDKEKRDEDDDEGDEDKTKDDQTEDTKPDGTVVFTYNLDINKLDSVTQEKLEGAKFVLYNNNKSKIAKLNANNNIDSWDDVTDGIDLTEYNFTIPRGAAFEIKGIDSGTYQIEETDAPADYVKLTDPIIFDITTETNGVDNINITGTAEWNATGLKTDDGSAAWANGTWVDITKSSNDSPANASVDNNGNLVLDVINVKGVNLPETGGMGTKMFYGIGGAAVLVSSVLLIAKKRMKKAE